MKKSITTRVAAVGLASAGVLGAAGAVWAAGGSARSSGPDYVYGEDNPFADASAAVHVVRTGNGRTNVTLHVWGAVAEPGRVFGAHVHQKPCGSLGTDAGGHYLHAGATGSLDQKEVWLDFAVNPDGSGHALAKRPWPLDERSPRSVIIHADPTNATGGAGARLACINLDGDA